MVKLEHIQETDLAFYAGVHSCRQESIWSSGRYIFPFLSNFLKNLLNQAKYHKSQ